ncbi:MAG: DNA repair protein RadA [Planctomycetes bacterium TMED75]|nr:DNA repair protein RadA [Planctomycetaceae bacterium]OUU94362.1 MAG: DNA repair protein RadA [Planctomycetes bacterium TMED75]
MAKDRTSFLCNECGAVQPQWAGRCPECGVWDALNPFTEPGSGSSGGSGSSDRSVVRSSGESCAQPIGAIELGSVPRFATGIDEVDRVLGGGFVPGASILLGGDPGVGKSTLLMQVAGALAAEGKAVLYASSEESAAQVRLRADRLGATPPEASSEQLLVLAETDLGRILDEARRLKPKLLLLDSIQMTWLGTAAGGGGGADSSRSGAGAASQLRRCATELALLAKKEGITVLIVGHVTKEGQLAGPKLLEHLVDVVLAFEGDRHHRHRILRSVKNRFGSTHEIGLFQMTAEGLEPVSEHSVRFDEEEAPSPGAAIVPTLAGSRCLLAEIQALSATGFLGSAKRRASGLDTSRLAMLIAVLEKHGGLRLADQDVFVSVAGGLRIQEPAADLAAALAIAGVHAGRALPPATAVFGELTLSGKVRSATGSEQRVSEAIRRGARHVLMPASQVDDLPAEHAVLAHGVHRLVDALEFLAPCAAAGLARGSVPENEPAAPRPVR